MPVKKTKTEERPPIEEGKAPFARSIKSLAGAEEDPRASHAKAVERDLKLSGATEVKAGEPEIIVLTDRDLAVPPALYEGHVGKIKSLCDMFADDKRIGAVERQLSERNAAISAKIRSISITDDATANELGALLSQNARNKSLVETMFEPIWRESKNLYDKIRSRRDDILAQQGEISSYGKEQIARWERRKRERLEEEQRQQELERQRIEKFKREEAAAAAKAEEQRQNRIREERMSDELAALPDDATEEQIDAILAKYGERIVVPARPIEMPPPAEVVQLSAKVTGNSSVESYRVSMIDKSAFVWFVLGVVAERDGKGVLVDAETKKPLRELSTAYGEWIDVDMGKAKKYANLMKSATSLPGISVWREDVIRTKK